MIKRFFVVFLLGFSSGLPLALLTGTLQAWFALSGSSVLLVSSLSLIGLPYNYRFLWAPLLDHYRLTRLGRRRSWMLLMQLMLLAGFNAMVWFSPASSPQLIIAIASLLACCSATQDVAVDAQRAEYLLDSEKAFGVSLANLGYRLALVLVGGGSLLIAHYGGWVLVYRLMGLLMLTGVVATLWSEEPPSPRTANTSLMVSFRLPVQAFFARKRLVILLLFVLSYKLGEAFTASTSGVVMPFLIQGIGFPLHLIAVINKVLGVVAAISGSLFAGVLLMHWSLYRALLVFGLLQSFSCVLFVVLASVGYNVPLFCLAVLAENFAAGLCSVALVSFFMQIIDKNYTATQFALLVALAFLPRTFAGPLAGAIQSRWGWVGLYELVSLGALLFLPLLYWLALPNARPLRVKPWLDTASILRHVN